MRGRALKDERCMGPDREFCCFLSWIYFSSCMKQRQQKAESPRDWKCQKWDLKDMPWKPDLEAKFLEAKKPQKWRGQKYEANSLPDSQVVKLCGHRKDFQDARITKVEFENHRHWAKLPVTGYWRRPLQLKIR